MANHVTTSWFFVVMFIFWQSISAADILNSSSTAELKNATVSSSTSTRKTQSDKDVTTVSSNTSDHFENDTSGAVFSSGSVPRKMDSGALLRGFYVLVGICGVIVIYVVVKMIRLRRMRSTTVRKYGVLTNQEDLEMAPLDADDEEDTTLFDASRHN